MNDKAYAPIHEPLEQNYLGLLSDVDTALRIDPKEIESILHPTLCHESIKTLSKLSSNGITASPGCVIGQIFYCTKEAFKFHQELKKLNINSSIILAIDELEITDLYLLGIIKGLITRTGGIASHTAVLAKSYQIPCIMNQETLSIDSSKCFAHFGSKKIESKTFITLNADDVSEVYLGKGSHRDPVDSSKSLSQLKSLIERISTDNKLPLKIKLNSNNINDLETGLNFGADGVGLLRTENMFDSIESLNELKKDLIIYDEKNQFDKLKKFESKQYNDYLRIFSVLKGKPINIRLIDIPIDNQRNTAKLVNEIHEIQIQAIIKASYEVSKKQHVDTGIMLPQVTNEKELTELNNIVTRIEIEVRNDPINQVTEKISFRIGAMIESPRGALSADILATVGDFFAFGTNDLTESTLGISRGNSRNSLQAYLDKDIFNKDPFKTLSPSVKDLVNIAVRRAQSVKEKAEFGICGEQSSDIDTIGFCLDNNLTYVSCSPYKVLPTKLILIQQYWQKKQKNRTC